MPFTEWFSRFHKEALALQILSAHLKLEYELILAAIIQKNHVHFKSNIYVSMSSYAIADG